MYDVRPEQYTTVIREMIRHENDVTNHRIMWLLIGQGFIANAFVTAEGADQSADLMLTFVGILVTLICPGEHSLGLTQNGICILEVQTM